MQQNSIQGVDTPIRSIINQLNINEESGAQVWRRMTITAREKLARAAFCPESIAHLPYESLTNSYRMAIKRACDDLAVAVKGFSDVR
jgi:hypothetical protein